MISPFNIPDRIDHHVFAVGKKRIGWGLDGHRIRRPCANNAFRIVLHPEKADLLDLGLDRLLRRTDLQRARNMKEFTEETLLFPLPLHRKNVRGDQIGAIGTDSPVWPRVRQPGMKIGIEYRFCRELESPAIHRG